MSASAAVTPRAPRALRVLDPGVLTTVQDDGRPGLAHLGVPRSGWLDAGAATLANRLVGNRDDGNRLAGDRDGGDRDGGDRGAAVLECLGGGLRLVAGAALTLAVTGARCVPRVDARPVAFAEPVTVPAGATVDLGPLTGGARAYLAVSGGVRVPAVLGSRATDTLSRLGPSPLAAGDELLVGPPDGRPAPVDALVHPGTVAGPAGSGAVTLRVDAGPRDDWFVDGLAALTRSSYTVASEADRVGVRLEGARLERSRRDELPSEGVVLGAVQVPADGCPLVFLRDHPTTGGYPVVAVVRTADLDRCAQLRPGDAVSFRRA